MPKGLGKYGFGRKHFGSAEYSGYSANVGSSGMREEMRNKARQEGREQHENEVHITWGELLQKSGPVIAEIQAIQRAEFDFMKSQGMLYNSLTFSDIQDNPAHYMRHLIEQYEKRGREAVIEHFAKLARTENYLIRSSLDRHYTPEEMLQVQIDATALRPIAEEIRKREEVNRDGYVSYKNRPAYPALSTDFLRQTLENIERKTGMSLASLEGALKHGPKPAPLPDDYMQIRMAMLAGEPAANAVPHVPEAAA